MKKPVSSYKVKVNADAEKEVGISGSEIVMEGNPIAWDVISTGVNRFHILRENRSYNCEVVEHDKGKKSFLIRVNGNNYTVQAKDRLDELLQQMGMESNAAAKLASIKAPMPGLVLKVMVAAGDEVKPGDSILILEAMKMENIIKSPGSGIVSQVKVKTRDAVEKNQVLIELK